MTTDPKDERGGDEGSQSRSAPSPSDPPPVREALADAISLLWEHVPGIAPRIEMLEASLTDPLPVSREAVLRAINETKLRSSLFGIDTVGGSIHPIIVSDITDAILALTGETSRE